MMLNNGVSLGMLESRLFASSILATRGPLQLHASALHQLLSCLRLPISSMIERQACLLEYAYSNAVLVAFRKKTH